MSVKLDPNRPAVPQASTPVAETPATAASAVETTPATPPPATSAPVTDAVVSQPLGQVAESQTPQAGEVTKAEHPQLRASTSIITSELSGDPEFEFAMKIARSIWGVSEQYINSHPQLQDVVVALAPHLKEMGVRTMGELMREPQAMKEVMDVVKMAKDFSVFEVGSFNAPRFATEVKEAKSWVGMAVRRGTGLRWVDPRRAKWVLNALKIPATHLDKVLVFAAPTKWLERAMLLVDKYQIADRSRALSLQTFSYAGEQFKNIGEKMGKTLEEGEAVRKWFRRIAETQEKGRKLKALMKLEALDKAGEAGRETVKQVIFKDKTAELVPYIRDCLRHKVPFEEIKAAVETSTETIRSASGAEAKLVNIKKATAELSAKLAAKASPQIAADTAAAAGKAAKEITEKASKFSKIGTGLSVAATAMAARRLYKEIKAEPPNKEKVAKEGLNTLTQAIGVAGLVFVPFIGVAIDIAWGVSIRRRERAAQEASGEAGASASPTPAPEPAEAATTPAVPTPEEQPA